MCQPPPAIKKQRKKLWHIAFKVLMCASSPTGPFQCPSTNFQRSEYWLLAAPRCLSLKAGSDRLACFVLLSSLQGGSVVLLFFILSLFPGCKIHLRLSIFLHVTWEPDSFASSIDFCLCSFFSPAQSKVSLFGLLNTLLLGRMLHVLWLYVVNPPQLPTQKWRCSPDASPAEVRRKEVGISNASLRRAGKRRRSRSWRR